MNDNDLDEIAELQVAASCACPGTAGSPVCALIHKVPRLIERTRELNDICQAQLERLRKIVGRKHDLHYAIKDLVEADAALAEAVNAADEIEQEFAVERQEAAYARLQAIAKEDVMSNGDET